jgi:hypothetical protein
MDAQAAQILLLVTGAFLDFLLIRKINVRNVQLTVGNAHQILVARCVF